MNHTAVCSLDRKFDVRENQSNEERNEESSEGPGEEEGPRKEKEVSGSGSR